MIKRAVLLYTTGVKINKVKNPTAKKVIQGADLVLPFATLSKNIPPAIVESIPIKVRTRDNFPAVIGPNPSPIGAGEAK